MFMKDFSELLGYDDLKTLFKLDNPYDQGEFMSEFINDICIVNNNKLFVKTENDIYEEYSNVDNTLLFVISKLFSESLNELNKNKKDKLKRFKSFQSNDNIKKYLPQIKMFLNRDNIKFNYTPEEIHFINGFINVRENKFYKERTDKHFITKYINRKYKPSTKEDRDEYFEKVINKIYNNKLDADLLLTTISTGLSWKAPTLQQSLFLIGKGSSGKSTILSHLQKTLECYFVELKSDTFSNDAKMDKCLNSFSGNCYLYSWINEMDSKRMDISVYKSFCDGVINTTKLYNDGSFNTKHNALSIATSNELPNMKQDTGSKRRILAYEHKSEFVDIKADVNEKENKFLKDKKLEETIPKYYNAIIDIYSSYCSQWLNGKFDLNYDKSENFKETKDLIVSANDYFQDFIEKMLIKTNDDNDRIGKNKMRDLFLESNRDKKINILQIITALKDHGIKYDKDKRHDGERGCFVGVKIKDGDDGDDPVEYGIIKQEQAIKQDMTIIEQMIFYEKKLKELQEKLLNDTNKIFKKETTNIKQDEKIIIKNITKIISNQIIEDNEYLEPDFEIDFN